MPYYAGDPGLFSRLKRVAKGAVSAVRSVAASPVGGLLAGFIPGGATALSLAGQLGFLNRRGPQAVMGGTPGDIAQVDYPYMPPRLGRVMRSYRRRSYRRRRRF